MSFKMGIGGALEVKFSMKRRGSFLDIQKYSAVWPVDFGEEKP